jgi:hypothetical protein
MDVNHKDHVRTNNAASNLEYLSHRDNTRLSLNTAKKKAACRRNGIACRKLSNEQVAQIRALYKPWKMSTYTLAKRFGVSQMIIHRIINGKSYF